MNEIQIDAVKSKIVSKPNYPTTILSKISKNIWRVKNIYDETGFYEKFDEIGKINMYEGFVLKQRDAGLRPPYRGGDNSISQLKVRKPTKNYRY